MEKIVIRVLFLAPARAPEVVELEASLRASEALVGGPLACVPLTPELYLWCNEAGGALALPKNIDVLHGHHIVPIYGPAFIAGQDQDETVSLSAAQLGRAQLLLRRPDVRLA